VRQIGESFFSMWRRITQNDGVGKVNASYNGSILTKITLTSSYKIFKNDSNENGCHFKKIIILVFK
jgi:hypothetical protein